MQGALEQGAFVSPEPAEQEVWTPREARIPATLPSSLKLHPHDPLDPFPSNGLTGFSAHSPTPHPQGSPLELPLATPSWAFPGGRAVWTLPNPKLCLWEGGWAGGAATIVSVHPSVPTGCLPRGASGAACRLPPAACWLADGCLPSPREALLPAVLVSSPGAGTAPSGADPGGTRGV